MYIHNENSKKVRAQECSDDNMIAGMASTEKHKIKLNYTKRNKSF